jgi:RNA-directed DNA polymerase
MKETRMNSQTDAWSALPWKQFQEDVFRLQERIAQAAKNGDRQKTHKLQRLLLNSFGAKCLAVRQVAKLNRGRHTAGVDGLKSLTNAQCLKLASSLDLSPTKSPVRRVWIPKPGKAELRPLGIPSMPDRAQQALVKMALEPEWEPVFEPNSYGFRPKRSCADAMLAVFNGMSKQRDGKFVLDADIRSCFDRIDHGALLQKLRTIPPIHRLVRAWLKAGVLDGLNLARPKAGTPQGGVISPLLCNIALHGLEAHVRSAIEHRNPPIVIRYADDLVVMHAEEAVIESCRAAVVVFLNSVGLELHPSKTTIRHTLRAVNGHDKPGFDFLGFHFKCIEVSPRQKPRGWIPLVTPSDEAVTRHYRNLCEIIDQCQATDQATLIARLNPVIRGWTNYYRCCNASGVKGRLGHLLFRKLWRWGHRRHTRKAKAWIVWKYWNDGGPWVFKDRDTGTTLIRHPEVRAKRHVKVRGVAHVFDRNREYWATRKPRRKEADDFTRTKVQVGAPEPRQEEDQIDLWR